MFILSSTIVYANALPFFSLLFFLFFIIKNPVFDKRQSRYFLIATIITLGMLIAISLDFTISIEDLIIGPNQPYYPLRRFTSFLNFATSPLIPLFIYLIFANKKIRKWFFVPAIVNIIICFFSMFTGIVFTITPENAYNRGPLFLMPFLMSVFYLCMLIFQSGHSNVKSKRAERLFLLFIVLTLSICMFAETQYRFMFLTWDFTAMCLILYYLLLNIHRTIIDPLTGAYNRLAYQKQLNIIENKKNCIIALIDINDFKNVNDEFGHEAGDNFLKAFTRVLEQAFSSIGAVYRIGGDEYVVITRKADKEKFEDALQHSRTLAFKNNMSFACGWDTYSPTQSLNDTQNLIDQAMYVDKARIKKERL